MAKTITAAAGDDNEKSEPINVSAVFGLPTEERRGRPQSWPTKGEPQVTAFAADHPDAFGVAFTDSDHSFPANAPVVTLRMSYTAGQKALKGWAAANGYKVTPVAKAFVLVKN